MGDDVTVTVGGDRERLSDDRIRAWIASRLDGLDLDGRSLCVVVPDATRKCPLRPILAAVEEAAGPRVRSCVVVIALGTHAPMVEADIQSMTGPVSFPVINHEWWRSETYCTVGELDRLTVGALSEGRLDTGVEVRINRVVTDADVTLIVGPVLPHEVVGYSGGNKYLFPGLSGQELIDLTHWLGALITSRRIIGALGTTPVRALIDAAADLVPGERHALCIVTDAEGEAPRLLAFGDPRGSWAAASEVAARTHVRYLPQPVPRVLSLVPGRYGDLWTGAKGFYKVEPVVADGGEVILYAPHINQISEMHPGLLEIGYHCRDYFLADWDRFRHTGWGELAHSTHLFGAGSYDPATGLEQQRVRVSLATSIPRETVEAVNLTYRDPASIDTEAWAEDPHTLVVPDAGEVLYRLEVPGRVDSTTV